jgi:uncharacterized protein with HEPN domain
MTVLNLTWFRAHPPPSRGRRFSTFYETIILEAIENIEYFIGNMDFNEFHADDKTRSAVVWKIGVIGEATKNIPKNVRDNYKELPWREMARMRDKISHFYFGVDYKIVWEVVKKRLPEIKPVIQKMLKEMKG